LPETTAMLTINPKEIKTTLLHSYMLSAIAPRPIAFASTMDKDGNPNLSPFSFFNAFGSNPPIVVFSPARRVRDNTTKHTLENVHEVKEVVINVVNYSMVHQASLASTEYPKGVNEFLKSGFTPLESVMVKPFRVKESPVQMECRVLNVIETGHEGGAANLIVCEILLMHISEDVLTEDKKIDQHKIDLVARMGFDWYCRASGNALFEVAKPNTKHGIGIDNIPEKIKLSKILTGNNLGQLGNVDVLPTPAQVKEYKQLSEIEKLEDRFGKNSEALKDKLHKLAKASLQKGEVDEAWKILLSFS
jgi:flavin reductase (DIM6/NTAB) family NADH-FMN oxidoreductase RutF